MIFRNTKLPYWALDISDLSLKMVGLAKKGSFYTITNYSNAKIPPGNLNNGKIIKEDAVVKIIQEFILAAKGTKIKSKFVKACLPEKHTFVKLISIPKMTKAEIPAAVEWAAEHHLPFSLDEIYLDWQIVDHQPNKKNIHIIIGAAPKEIVDSYTSLMKKTGLTPLSLEIEAIAIARTLINNKLSPTHQEAIGIIDIGASRSSFIIYAHDSIQSTFSLPLSGQNITQTIADKLSLTLKQAENAKIICGVDPKKCKGGISIILNKELASFTNKIISSIKYYQKNFDNVLPFKEIILCGGGANMKQLATYLTANLKIKTSKGDPRQYLTRKQSLNIPDDEILSYTTALGLALNIN